MKKLLAFLLVLVMILSITMVACNKKTEEPANDDDDDWGNGSVSESEESSDTSDTTGGSNNPSSPSTPLTWTDVADSTVYIALRVTLRNSPSDNDKTGIILEEKTAVTKTEESNGKWIKIVHAENTYYIPKYVVVNNLANITFDNIEPGIVTNVIDNYTTNLRTSACYGGDYDSEVKDLIAKVSVTKADTSNGELIITGRSQDQAWIRVSYNGTTYYCRPAALQEYQTGGSTGGGLPTA